jgi:molybdenum cofactor biosynthesis enzyme MoaA
VATQSLTEIWNGARRRFLVDQLGNGLFPDGCEGCAAEIEIEGRADSYPELFDRRLPLGHPPPDSAAPSALELRPPEWPSWMEFNLSNRCNLQCVQCDGELSSAIRIHRERRAPLMSPYGDRFFEELVPFLPHLREAQFAGGEPFLAEENYRVWDLIAEYAAGVTCVVITNATHLTARVERAMESVRMGFTLSIDGVRADTFGGIRVGADLGVVRRNAQRLIAHSRTHGTPISINHCLMPQNVHEFAELLAWADDLDVDVQVSVVRGPAHCSLARLGPTELNAVVDGLRRQHEEIGRHLGRNRSTWDRELQRISAWANADRRVAEDVWARSRYAAVLGFEGLGSGPSDDVPAQRDLAAWGGEVHSITVLSNDLIHRVSPNLPALLGRTERELVGVHVERTRDLLAAALGPLRSYEVTAESENRRDAAATFERATVRLATVPIRDDRGIASEGRLLFAVRASTDHAR